MGNRWLIVGQLGSGKSTLGHKLSKKLNVTNIQLDELIWDKDWKEVSNKELQKRVNKRTQQTNGYVVEGVLVEKLEKKFIYNFDGIIFLDIPFRKCFIRARKRNFSRMIRHEKFCGENYENVLSFTYSAFGTIFKHRMRRKSFTHIASEARESMIFKSNIEANEWLKSL